MSHKPTDEDQPLFDYAMKGVRRWWADRAVQSQARPSSQVPAAERQEVKSFKNSTSPAQSQYDKPSRMPETQLPELDRRTEMRLIRGQIRPEARLDLHGMTQIQAQDHLQEFIKDAVSRNKRCILVITGKGTLSQPAVLRTQVPVWLAAHPDVLKYSEARPKDGGAGALYVYLKRRG